MQKTLVATILCTALAACAEQKAAENRVARGEYLVAIMGCQDCHTPKVMDPAGHPVPDKSRLLSGHPEGLPHPTWGPSDLTERHAIALSNPDSTAWAGPWGVSFAINLTPDPETGIGEWTEEAFVAALRTGKHQGQPNGRAILPPMPWDTFRHLSDEDMKAVWEFLRSIPPVKNPVPLPIPPQAGAVPTAGSK